MIKKLDDDLIRLNRLDWEKCKAFYYVAKFGKILSASRHINISYPALSKKISLLEQELGCKLFIRNSNGVTLTREGKDLFEIVEHTFLELRRFSYQNNLMNNGTKRKIRISTTHAIATYVLNEHLLDFMKLHPNIIFEVITDDQCIDLIINDVDMAIRPYDEITKGVEQEYLFTLKKHLYASTEYLKQYGKLQTVDDLKNHHIIAPSEPKEYPYSDVTWILKLGLPEGQLHQPIYTSNSLECLVKTAEKGIGIIGGYDKMDIIKGSKLQEISLDIETQNIDEYIIYPKYLEKDKLFLVLKTFIINRLKN